MKTFVKLSKLFLIAISLITALGVCSCSKMPTEKTQIKLTFWTLQLNNFAPFIKDIIAQYEKNHPNIHIDWVDIPFSEGEKRTLAAVMSENVPDIINLNPSFASTLQQKKVLKIIDNQLNNIYIAPALDLCKSENDYFAIPWYVTSPIIIYNTRLLENTGFHTPPESIKKLLPFSLVIKNKTNKYAFMPNLAEDGAMLKIMAKQNIKGPQFFTSKKTHETYKIFRELYSCNLIPKGSINQTHRDSLEKFMTGETVFLEAGSNFIKTIKENAPEVYNNSKVISQMDLKDGVISISLMNLVIPKKSKHPKEAEEFALFITSPEAQLGFCKLAPVLPSTKKTIKDTFFLKDESLIDKARKISANQLKKAQSSIKIMPNQKQLNEVVDYATQTILLEGKSIEKTLIEAQEKLMSP